MPSVGDSHSRPKRTYITRACEECKRRRQKCDGGKPQCGLCSARGDACRYPTEDNRKPASKTYVDLLRHRITLLEQLLKVNDIDIETGLATLAAEQSAAISGRDDNIGETKELSEALDGLLSIQEPNDGHPRYYGPTSWNAQIQLPDQEEHVELLGTDSGHLEPRNHGDNNSRIYTPVNAPFNIPPNLKAELVDLFFKFQNCWCWIINERLYRKSANIGGRFWSPLLEYCILAIGSRFTDAPEVRNDASDSKTAGLAFLEHAESLLDNDLRRPNLTTIQALVCLEEMRVATGEDARAYLHSGTAAQIALDMGLNVDPTAFANSPRGRGLEQDEIELRRQIYWTLYCDDKFFAAYTGRVCLRLDHQASVQLPTAQSYDDGGTTLTNMRTLALLQISLIGMCRILENISVSLYMPVPSCRGSSQRRIFFDSTIIQLRTWLYDLDSDLRLEKAHLNRCPPSLFEMHMIHHTAMIHLTKPFWNDPELSGKAKKASLNAARQTCVIARQYRQVYGSFRCSPVTATHSILSAVLVLLELDNDGSGHALRGGTSENNILLCLKSLHELSTAWQIAARVRANLLRLIRGSKSSFGLLGERDSSASILEGALEHSGNEPDRTIDSQQNDGLLATNPSTADDVWFGSTWMGMGLENTLENMIDQFIPANDDLATAWDMGMWRDHNI